jgi:hypothetical protein
MTSRDRVALLHNRLAPHGVTWDDAASLRRIAMTLARWHELECGDEHGRAIERDDITGKPFVTYDRGNMGERGRYRTPDRERGALKRLGRIMANYPTLTAYVQGDPRGEPLYILPPGVTEANYYHGVAVQS